MTDTSPTTHKGWTDFWSLLFPARRAPARRPVQADSARLLERMSPHALADLPALHEAA